MTDSMWAFRLVDWQEAPRLVEIPVPEPGPGQVLVRVAGNGLCHSDLHMMQMPGELGPTVGWRVPFTLGHETAGWVERCGHGATRLSEGMPVALVSPNSCGRCRECLSGHDNVCSEGAVGRGYGRDGGLADFVLVDDPRFILPLAGLDPVDAGPLTDAGATAYHAFRLVSGRLGPGSTAVLIGAGGLGGFAVQYVKRCSQARLVVVENSESRRQRALALGADCVVDGQAQGLADELRGLTEGRGADAVLDFVGSDSTLATAVASLARLGRLCVVGAEQGCFPGPLFASLANREASVISFQGPTIADTVEVLRLAGEGVIDNPVQRFPLQAVASAYEKLQLGQLEGRAVIVP
jgi:propanol-preferring alcohol dehydrogenase